MDNTHYMPDNFSALAAPVQARVAQYVESLDNIEKKALIIAKDHLGSSFNIVKSNGYINWLKTVDAKC